MTSTFNPSAICPGMYNAATAFGLSTFMHHGLAATSSNVATGGFCVNSSSYNPSASPRDVILTSRNLFSTPGLLSLSSDRSLVEQAPKIKPDDPLSRKAPPFTQEYAYASAAGAGYYMAASDDETLPIVQAMSGQADEETVTAPDLQSFRSLIRGNKWQEALKLIKSQTNYSDPYENLRQMEEVFVEYIDQNGADQIPDKFIVKVSRGIVSRMGPSGERLRPPRVASFNSAKVFKALLGVRAFDKAKCVYQGVNQVTQRTGDARRYRYDSYMRDLMRAQVEHINEQGADAIRPDVIMCAFGKEEFAATPSGGMVPVLFKALLQLRAWENAKSVVELVSKAVHDNVKTALDDALTRHIVEGEDNAVNDSVLEAAASLGGVFSPAASEIKAYLRDDNWEKVKHILAAKADSGSVAYGIPERALVIHMRESGNNDDIPDYVLETALNRFGSYMDIFFGALFRLGIWKTDGIAYAHERTQIGFERALAKHMETQADKVPNDVIAAAAKLNKTDPDTNVKYLNMLLDRGSWPEVRGVLTHANDSHHDLDDESVHTAFEGAIAAHMARPDADAVPGDVIAATANMRWVTISRSVEYLEILLQRKDWSAVKDVLDNAKQFNQETQRRFKVVLDERIPESDLGVIPTDVIAEAARLEESPNQMNYRYFKKLLARKAWDDAKEVLAHAHENFTNPAKAELQRALDDHVSESHAEPVPDDVIAAAANMRRSIIMRMDLSALPESLPVRPRFPEKAKLKQLEIRLLPN